MGTISHDAMIVMSYGEHADEARAKVIEIVDRTAERAAEVAPHRADFATLVSPVIDGLTNGYRSFFIAPDGSKEWWDTSDHGNEFREEVREALADDDWATVVEVRWGELGTRLAVGSEVLGIDGAVTDDFPKVQGFCPYGCGATLFLGAGGFVTCSFLGCPNPTAVSTILGERETEHLVTIWSHTWTAKHPLRERINDELLTCGIGNEGFTNWVPGRYRVPCVADGTYRWTRLEEAK